MARPTRILGWATCRLRGRPPSLGQMFLDQRSAAPAFLSRAAGRWWRLLVYTVTTPPLALAAAMPLAMTATPWVVLTAILFDGEGSRRPAAGLVVLLAVLGAVTVPVLGPAVALPLAVVERWRMRLVDAAPATGEHRLPPRPGLWTWVVTRYTEPATWRELAYAWLLATVLLTLTSAGLLLVLCAGTLIAGPLIVDQGADRLSLGFDVVVGAGDAVPYAIAGLAMLPVLACGLPLLAVAHRAIARALLHGEEPETLRSELTEVARSRSRLVDAFEAERRRIERDLHDGAQQRLLALTMRLALARLEFPADSPAGQSVTEAHHEAKELMAELRELIRGIHPRVLTDRGLPAALNELADRCPVPVTVDAGLTGRLPSHVEGTAYFVTAEALTNVAKHSGATMATISLRPAVDTLVLDITDDGRGGVDPSRGTGLTGLADRVAVMAGKILISSPVGGPTLLRVELPCNLSDSPSV